jgi:uncharacterized protein (TIGR01777 family)
MFNKRVLVGGGSGFVGRHLTSTLLKNNNIVTILSRSPAKASKEFKQDKNLSFKHWNDLEQISPDDVDVAINVTGIPVIQKRWNTSFKQQLIDSRVKPSKQLIQFLQRSSKPKTFVGTSAVGFYDSDQFSKIFTEESQSKPANNELGELCAIVENTINETTGKSNVTSVIIRPGAVIGPDGGIIDAMVPPYLFYMLVKFGSGKQPFPWIHVHDLARLYLFAAENSDKLNGSINGTAPQQVNAEDFIKALCRALNRPTSPLIAIPGSLLKLLMGNTRALLILEGAQVVPKRAIDAGFQFNYPDLQGALTNACKGKTITSFIESLFGRSIFPLKK